MNRQIVRIIKSFLLLLLAVSFIFTTSCDNTDTGPCFVAASGLDSEPGRLRYSDDGITWGPGDMTLLAASSCMLGLAYGEDHIVGVGIGNYTVDTTNGMDWTTTNLGSQQYWYDLVLGEYHNQSPWQPYFAAVGYNGGVMYTTDFGQNWTSGTSGVAERLNGVAFGYTNEGLSTFVTAGNS